MKDNIMIFNEFMLSHITNSDPNVIKWHKDLSKCDRYLIEDDEYEEFIEKYTNMCITNGLYNDKKSYCYLEKQKKYGPILIDFDFEQSISTRQYTDKHIEKIISYYFEFMNQHKITNPDASTIRVIIMEKDNPTLKKQKENIIIYKDGFHAIITVNMKDILRKEAYEYVKRKIIENKIFKNIEILNSENMQYFDDSVVSRNNWIMCFGLKPGGQYYKISHYFDHDLELIDDEYEIEDIIKMTSIRYNYGDIKCKNTFDSNKEIITKTPKNKLIPIEEHKEEFKSDISIHDSINYKSLTISDDSKRLSDIEKVKQIIPLLSAERANTYGTWISVCFALRNISDSLLPEFIKFSQKSNKYDFKKCEKYWKGKRKEDGYTIASLLYWAKQDSPESYTELIRTELNNAAMNTTGDYDIANIIISNLENPRVFIGGGKSGDFYCYKNHRWQRESKESFSKALTTIEVKKIEKFYNDTAGNQNLRKFLDKIISKLKSVTGLKSIVTCCETLLVDDEFLSKIDERKELLGFNNGVFDFNNMVFRPGLPSDYITKTVGYDFIDKIYDLQSPEILKISDFFEKIQPIPEMRKYLYIFITSCLTGHIRDQQVLFWTGVGSNGKSVLLSFLQQLLGDYFSTMSITSITRKRSGSSNAEPELANKKGIRFIALNEPEPDDEIQSGFLKNISGDDIIETRALYKEPIKFKPQFKICIVCNKLPTIRATDGGTWRRIRVLPFTSCFVDTPKPGKSNQFPRDDKILDFLKDFKAIFMNILISQFYIEYRDAHKGLSEFEPEGVTSQTYIYSGEQNIYKCFIDDKCKIDPSNLEDITSLLYNKLSRYFHEKTGKKPANNISLRAFKQFIEDKGINPLHLVLNEDRD